MHLQMHVSVQHLPHLFRILSSSKAFVFHGIEEDAGETGERRVRTASPGSFMAATGGGEQTRLTLTHHAAREG